jgi:N-acetylmuramoyl-L-alanine amidase
MQTVLSRLLAMFEEIMISKRSIILFFLTAGVVLFSSSPSSYASEASSTFAVAIQRLTDLQKDPSKNRYRSYWIDCIRMFELIQKKYKKSAYASDACFYGADIYGKLYQRSRLTSDIDESLQTYEQCQASYPRHPRAAEALYRVIEIELYYKKDAAKACDVYSRLSKLYPSSRWTARARVRLKKIAPKELAKRITAAHNKVYRHGDAVSPAIVKEIRYRSSGDYTRIVIDHDKRTKYRVLELKHPPRLVFDLLDAHLKPFFDKEAMTVNDGILRQVRANQFERDIVRVVLDLDSIKSYGVFPLRDPDRLVIDVMGDGIKDSKTEEQASVVSVQRDGPQRPAAAQTTHSPAIDRPLAGDISGLSLSRQLGLKIRTIAIDAGHGGHDPGAIGKRGTKEKDITLDIAKRLAVLVKKRLGCNVIMTRNSDEFIALEDRPAIARTKGADLFVSVHVNATRRRTARGVETYIQGLRASDRNAMETASRENATTARTLGELDDELSKILTGLRMESNDEDSIHLAHAVQRSLVKVVKPVQSRTINLGVKRAFFYVLINTGMPSILAEVGFISNPTEEKLLRQTAYRQSIAEAIYEGLKKYVKSRELRCT